MSSDVEGLDLEALEKVAREATPGPWMKEVSVHSNGMLDAHFAVRTVDKHPDHPWSPRFITFMTGTLRSDLRVNDIKGAKYCRECEAWHLGWSREIGVDVRADAKCEADATFIATFDPPTVLRLLAALRAQADRVRVLEGENEQLRLAICGGEDAPGYAASLPLEKILSVAKDNERTLREYSDLAFDGTGATWEARAEAAERRAGELEGAMRLACDLLAERTYGSRARSPGHNARLVLESALLPATQAEGEK